MLRIIVTIPKLLTLTLIPCVERPFTGYRIAGVVSLQMIEYGLGFDICYAIFEMYRIIEPDLKEQDENKKPTSL